MSAAEHQSSNSSQSVGKSLKQPPQRPSLTEPPHRSPTPSSEAVPAPAKPSRPEVQSSTEDTQKPAEETSKPAVALHPISPPSERMQYRAIGLVRGTYTPTEEQINRGCLKTEDGTEVDSVLLGRVTSLVKKYIDLETSHLWVVYPRTRQADEANKEGTKETDLHLQIVGVWEPETLGMPGETPDAEQESQGKSDQESPDQEDAEISAAEVDETAEASVTAEAEIAEPEAMPEPEATLEPEAAATPEVPEPEAVTAADVSEPETVASPEASDTPEPDGAAESPSETAADDNVGAASVELPSENYFSIRGEILEFDEDTSQIQVKILQAAKRQDKSQRAFRLHIAGQISGKIVGYFWELDVERQGKHLVLLDGRAVGIVPPKKAKRKKRGRPPGGGQRRPSHGPRHQPSAPQSKSKPRIRPPAPVKSNPL